MISNKENLKKISYFLKEDYPIVVTPLSHKNVFELMIAVILSAQTLDATVNKITLNFFKKFPDLFSLSKASFEEIDFLIKSVNYHKTKASNLVKLSSILVKNYRAKIPSKMDELIKLPGIGRKTANVIINEWFVKKERMEPEGFVVDTHVKRVSLRLGLTKNTNPLKIEQDLMKIFPKNEWADMSLRLIFHGRYRCTAKNPKCRLDFRWKTICGCCN